MKEIRDGVVEIVIRTNRNVEKQLDKQSLISDGILDSLDIMIIIDEMEKTFSIEIDPSDVSARNFESVDTMVALVMRSNTASGEE